MVRRGRARDCVSFILCEALTSPTLISRLYLVDRTFPDDLEQVLASEASRDVKARVAVANAEDEESASLCLQLFLKLALIRSLRPDRTVLAALSFIKALPYLGRPYVDAVSDHISSIYEE